MHSLPQVTGISENGTIVDGSFLRTYRLGERPTVSTSAKQIEHDAHQGLAGRLCDRVVSRDSLHPKRNLQGVVEDGYLPRLVHSA